AVGGPEGPVAQLGQRHHRVDALGLAEAGLREGQVPADVEYGRSAELLDLLVESLGGQGAGRRVEAGHDVQDPHLAREVRERDVREVSLRQLEFGRLGPDLGQLSDGMNLVSLKGDSGHVSSLYLE